MTDITRKTIRTALVAGLIILCLVLQASASEQIRLRPSITVENHLVTLGDLFENLGGDVARTPVFRSPDPGQSGVVSVSRVAAAAENHGVYWENHGLLGKVSVTRAATEVPLEVIRNAIDKALRDRLDIARDANFSVELKTDSRPLRLHPAASGEIQVASLRHDSGSGQFVVQVSAADGPDTERGYVFRGTAFEKVHVPTIMRFIAQGKAIRSEDLVMTEKPKNRVPAGVLTEMSDIVGKAARRNLLAEYVIRASDLTDFVKIPMLSRAIARGEEIKARDVVMKPVARNMVPIGIALKMDEIVGKAARHSLLAEHPVRPDELDVLAEIPVLARSIPRGAQIGPRDVEMRKMARSLIARGIEMDTDSIVGMSARRGLSAGYGVHPTDLEEPRMVQRGRLVGMKFKTKSLTLTARGRALQDGSKGDVVRVKNIRSNQTVEAVVVGPEKVVVISGNSLTLSSAPGPRKTASLAR